MNSNTSMLKTTFLTTFLLCSIILGFSQARTIHVFVALCDNEHQGIAPVPAAIGNGKDPGKNLYWGAGYGIKTFFDRKTTDWKLVKKVPSENPFVLERILFKHKSADLYMLADAYDGEQIKPCTQDMLRAANGQNPLKVQVESQQICFGGEADLIAYIGHNGLMEFFADVEYVNSDVQKRDLIILACYSKSYFSPEVKQSGANPILWTTHLMAPEAYTLKAAIDGWMKNESGKAIDERAAQAYHAYQKCGIRGARNLFTTGF